MKIKTSKLTGHELDWAVAFAEDRAVKIISYGAGPIVALVDPSGLTRRQYLPHIDWSQGGPIIERERMLLKCDKLTWVAYDYRQGFWSYGDTPLIAAMRCFVQSKLGYKVHIPNKLCQE